MIQALLKGLALGLILTLSVGPVIFAIIKQSINNGKEGGFSFVAGVWLSDILIVIVSNAFSEWVTHMLIYKQLIGYAGSGFLVSMGLYFAIFKKVKARAAINGIESRLTKSDLFKSFLSGFFINTLNPNVTIFWLINATAFAVTNNLRQRIVIFSVCLVFNMISDVFKVMMAGKLAKKLTLHNMKIINKVSGSILVAFGLLLLYGAFFLVDKMR